MFIHLETECLYLQFVSVNQAERIDFPEGTQGTLCPLRYKGGEAVYIACMYACMLGVWMGALGLAGNAFLFFPFKIMGNSSCSP
jgi:hypothetical protein